jgi:hypothetical protein
MQFVDLDPATLDIIKSWRFDRIIEKHEGPQSWESFLSWLNPELLAVGDAFVLLPIERDQNPNITVLRSYASTDGESITLFLRDTSLAEYYEETPEMFWAGFLAVCDRVRDKLYAAVVFHEWFIVENSR